MQVINVRFENGVFVPTEPVNMGEDQEAVVVVSEKKDEKSEESAQYYQDKARQHFKKNFPDLEVSERILELVGILHKHSGKYDRSADYADYAERRCLTQKINF